MNEIKKVLDKFCIAVTVVLFVTIVCCGKLTAEQRGEKMIYGTEYKSVMLEKGDDKISVSVDENKISFDMPLAERLSKYKDYISLTPFYAVNYFVDCVKALGQYR